MIDQELKVLGEINKKEIVLQLSLVRLYVKGVKVLIERRTKISYLGDRELEKKYAGYSVKQLNAKLDKMPNTNSKGGGSKAEKIRKIHKFGGRLRLNPE